MATKTITIDVWKPLRERVTVVQREAGARTLSFRITSNGAALDLTGKTVTFYATKPDDSIVFNACTVTSAAAGKCTCLITAQTVAITGTLTACLIIIGAGYELRTQDFAVTIDASPDYTAAVESTDEFTAFAALAGEIAQATADVDAIDAVAGIIKGTGANAYAAAVGADVMALVWPLVYPVGCIYQSVVSTSPATLFGGTWSALGAGKVLVGIDAGDAAFDTVEETGGAKTHTLSSAEIPAHTHTLTYGTYTPGNAAFALTGTNSGSANTGSTGDGGAHNNLQPYLVVYRWKRVS